jgi:hypothetical protein
VSTISSHCITDIIDIILYVILTVSNYYRPKVCAIIFSLRTVSVSSYFTLALYFCCSSNTNTSSHFQSKQSTTAVTVVVTVTVTVMAMKLLGIAAILVAITLSLAPSVEANCGPSVDHRGNLNMDFSLYNCSLGYMNDPLQPITHVKMYVDQGVELTVVVKFEFNNLVSINELENTATVDFFYRIYWQDIRWNMSKAFWDLAPLSAYHDGIELAALTFDAETPLPYWRPDLHFIDVLEIDTFAELVKLRPGEVNWLTSSIFKLIS